MDGGSEQGGEGLAEHGQFTADLGAALSISDRMRACIAVLAWTVHAISTENGSLSGASVRTHFGMTMRIGNLRRKPLGQGIASNSRGQWGNELCQRVRHRRTDSRRNQQNSNANCDCNP